MGDTEEIEHEQSGPGGDKRAPRDVRTAARRGCPVKMSKSKLCGREIHTALGGVDEVPVCLMHSRDLAKLAQLATEFQEVIDAILDSAGNNIADFRKFVFFGCEYNSRVFEAECDFRSAIFERDANFAGATFAKDANFEGAKFGANGSFRYAKFMLGATFRNAKFASDAGGKGGADADFERAEFAKYADFRGLIIQRAGFERARFSDDANFGLATFAEEASFNEAIFSQGAVFREARFEANAYFDRAMFAGYANFWRATFLQDVTFANAIFARTARFESTTFTKEANFSRAKFSESAEFLQTQFLQRDKKLHGPVFFQTVFSHPEMVAFFKTDLSLALFHSGDVSNVNFSGAIWAERPGSRKRMVFEEEVDLKSDYASTLRFREGNPEERDYHLIAELYQQLKKNYDDRKDYWTAGDFHYGEMEMKRLTSPPEGGSLNTARRWWHQRMSLIAWYKYVSEYGENYRRPLLWLAGVLVLFACLFPLKGIQKQVDDEKPARTYWDPAATGKANVTGWEAEARLFGDSTLDSVDVAAFQKNLIYEPAYRTGRALVLVEMLLTSSLFALFLLALRRQFRR